MNKNTEKKTRRWAAGFTLLEMMLVVVIIGLLAGSVVVAIGAQGGRAREKTTVLRLQNVKTGLETYALSNNGRYPPQLIVLTQGATAPLEKLPKDGWGQELAYFYPSAESGRPYSLFSIGADGMSGTEDDMSVWDAEE